METKTKIVTFTLPASAMRKVVFRESPAEKDQPAKIEIDMMIFSTAYNRNRAYFQVSQLLKWSNKLTRIGFNFNHDLALSEKRYLKNTNQFSKIEPKFVDGETEIWATFASTDPAVIEKRDDITAPSIELLVAEENTIRNERGEYFTDFDWVGTALLLGVPQGSGDSRVVEVREYTADLSKELEPAKSELELFKSHVDNELNKMTAQFAVAQAKVLSDIKNSSNGNCVWVAADGNEYTRNWEEIYNETISVIESQEVPESTENPLIQMMKAKGFSFTKTHLDKMSESLTKAEKIQEKMSNFRTEELLEDRSGALETAKTKDNYVQSKYNFIKSILK